MQQDRLGAYGLENSFAGKDLRTLVDKLTTNQQYAAVEMRVNHTLSSINKNIASVLKDMIVSLCLALVRLHLEYYASVGLQTPTYWCKSSRGPSRRLENMTYEERLRELDSFSLQ